MPCPKGMICSSFNTNNVAKMNLCPDGYVCDEATGLIPQISCPAGYICPSGTVIDDMYEIPCPSGLICGPNTGVKTTNTICPINQYCPLATKLNSENNVLLI